MQSVNRRIAVLFYASVMKVLKVRPGVRRKKDFIVRLVQLELRGTTMPSSYLSLSWLENLVRICNVCNSTVRIVRLWFVIYMGKPDGSLFG